MKKISDVIFEILDVVIIYSFLGISTMLVWDWKNNEQFSKWLIFVIYMGILRTLILVSRHYKSYKIKLFGKINLAIIGILVFLCTSFLMDFYF